jgi:hypothetical protein
MATGDQADIAARISRWLPARWFPSGQGTLIGALAAGFGAAFASLYAAIAFAALQLRIATAGGGFLELIAGDYFGNRLPRNAGEADAAYSTRIRREILRERVTREAIDRVIFDTTGNHPAIVELNRPADIGGWRQGFAWYTRSWTGPAGSYGSKQLPFQVFITTPRINPLRFPTMGGWEAVYGAYRGPNFAYALPAIFPPPPPPDATIIAALERVRASGVTYWLQLQ